MRKGLKEQGEKNATFNGRGSIRFAEGSIVNNLTMLLVNNLGVSDNHFAFQAPRILNLDSDNINITDFYERYAQYLSRVLEEHSDAEIKLFYCEQTGTISGTFKCAQSDFANAMRQLPSYVIETPASVSTLTSDRFDKDVERVYQETTDCEIELYNAISKRTNKFERNMRLVACATILVTNICVFKYQQSVIETAMSSIVEDARYMGEKQKRQTNNAANIEGNQLLIA